MQYNYLLNYFELSIYIQTTVIKLKKGNSVKKKITEVK